MHIMICKVQTVSKNALKIYEINQIKYLCFYFVPEQVKA